MNPQRQEMTTLSVVNVQPTKSRLLIKNGKHYIPIRTEDIAMVISRHPIVGIRMLDGREYLGDFTVEGIFEILPHRNFFRINRQIIINYAVIKKVTVRADKLVLDPHLKGSPELLVSRERTASFKHWMDS
jgi:two-component system response regulator LytT